MKGQTSLEFFIVISTGLVISSPFILEAQNSVGDVSLMAEDAQFQSSLNRLERAIERVSSMQEPATENVSLNLPGNIEQAYVFNETNVIFVEDRAGQQSNYTRIFDTRINSDGLPKEEGVSDVKVEAWNGEVNLSYQE